MSFLLVITEIEIAQEASIVVLPNNIEHRDRFCKLLGSLSALLIIFSGFEMNTA